MVELATEHVPVLAGIAGVAAGIQFTPIIKQLIEQQV